VYFEEHHVKPETETLLLFISIQYTPAYVTSSGFIGQGNSLLFLRTGGFISSSVCLPDYQSWWKEASSYANSTEAKENM